MSERMIKGLLIDPITRTYAPSELVDDIHTYYDRLHCSLIDITHICVLGHVFAVVCDDEGLLKSDPLPAIVRPDGCLVGACFVTRPSDDDGYLQSLTDDDLLLLQSFLMPLSEYEQRFHVPTVLVALG